MPAQQMPQEQAPQFQSNNPFNQYAFPAPPTAPPGIAHEDDDLRRAIELSTQQEEEDRGRRVERERSVRASAPPPSPGRIDDDGQVVGSLFGPSNKEDLKGALAMVPTDNVRHPCRPLLTLEYPVEQGRRRLPACHTRVYDDRIVPLGRRREQRHPPTTNRARSSSVRNAASIAVLT